MPTKFQNYLLVGITAFLAEYSSFAILYFLANNLLVSQTLSFLLGLTISFIGSRNITFNTKNKNAYTRSANTQLVMYAFLAVLNLILTNALIHGLVEVARLTPLFAKIVTMGMVVMWNYLIFNKLIFKTK